MEWLRPWTGVAWVPSSPKIHSDRNSEAQSALVCGEAFQRVAEGLIPKIPLIEVRPSFRMPPEVGDVAVCATSLAFAVELYLKALLIHLGMDYSKASGQGHDLKYLYGRLPEYIREMIEGVYDQVWLSDIQQRKWPRSFALRVAPLGDREPPDYRKPLALPEVLNESRDLFSAWRYVSETRPMGLQVFHYDSLRMVAETLRVESTVRLGQGGEDVEDAGTGHSRDF